MLDFLRDAETVLVTGPQRSGTTVTAKIIADLLGFQYVDENAYDVHYLDRAWPYLIPRHVIHAPGLSAYCHLLPPSVTVVFVRRNLADIIASQSKLAMGGGRRWIEDEDAIECRKYFRSSGPSAALKYASWEQFQRLEMSRLGKPFFELKYPDDIKKHHFYLEQDSRAGFSARQTA